MQDIEELAVGLFSKGRITVSEAAEMAHLPLGEMMELLSARGVKSKITLEDYEEGLFNAEKAL